MKRLLTTSPGSATPTLAVLYNPETTQSELALITHIVPTMKVEENVCDSSGWSRPAGAYTPLDQGNGSF